MGPILPLVQRPSDSCCWYIDVVIMTLLTVLQVTGLPPGVRGACLHANLSRAQRERVVAAIAAGEIHFLLISPETAVQGGRGAGGLPPPDLMPTIAFACIDEAHCVSEWSHHFRPSYLRICKVNSVYSLNRMPI